jgi:hypothetical protein
VSKTYHDAEWNRQIKLQKIKDLRKAYEAMLKKVQAWKPPTEDHRELKQFMIDQILESIRFDCIETYYSKPTVRLTGSEWFEQRQAELREDIVRHTEGFAEDVARAKNRTEWVRALRTSL